MIDNNNISAIILAYDEEDNIKEAITSLTTVLDDISKRYEVLVVLYEASTDNTENIIKKLMKKNTCLKIVYQKKAQKGYGKALKIGIENAKYDSIFYTDADNQFNAENLKKLLLFTKNYDIVAGLRTKRKDPFMRLVFAKIYNIFLNITFDVNFKDVDCAFKIYNKKIFNTISLSNDSGLIDAEIMIKSKAKGFKIKEVPVDHYPRKKGKVKFDNGGMVKFKVIKELFHDIQNLKKELSQWKKS